MTAAGDAASAIDIVQLPNRRIEADFAVSRVLRWVQDSRAGYRLSDVAIIVRDIDLYHDLLSEALDSRGVPFFIDRRRPVIHHPLVELIRAAFAMATNDWTIESVCAALRTGLVPITMDDADLLENYLIAHGIEGVQRWGASDWSFRSRSRFIASTESPTKDEAVALDRINALRKDILALFESWMRIAASPGAPTGSAWAAAIRSLIQHMDVPGSLRRWSNNAERDGELERAEEHRQVWGDVMSLVDDMGFALSETAMSATEVAEVIDAGLSQLTLALAPPTIDQLLVGSIERSRHPRIKAAVIVGFNDEVFPKRPAEDSVLNDDDRSALLDAGVRIGLPAKSRFIDECMLCYIALTRASQRVVVTYASADETGAALRPSSYLPAVLQACPGLQPRIVGDPVRTRDTWDIWSHRDLVERLSAEFRTRPAPAKDDRAVRARWNTLYDFRRRAVGDDSATARGLASLDPRLDARVSSAMIERMFAGSLRTSVSQLESYATCPFQFFARHGLRLKERERAQLEPVDIGLVHHAVLEDFVRGMADASRGWEALSEDQLIHELSGSCRRVERRLPEDASSSQARNAYVLRRSAEQLARVIRAQQDVGRRGRTRPRIAELPFGFATTRSWPALELETPQGRRVRVRGYIDRVDLAELSDELLGVVIDYKRTRDKRLELSRVYHGLSLQLIAYLLVLQEHGRTLAGRPIRPIGALFVSLMPQYQVVDHPSALDDDPGRERRAHPPRGLISVEDVAALESSSPDGLSGNFSLFKKKCGGYGRMDATDGAARPAFDAVLLHVHHKLGQLADGILDGDVTPRPYRLAGFSPCSWCEMGSVCRFELSLGRPRYLETMRRTRVLDLIQIETTGP